MFAYEKLADAMWGNFEARLFMLTIFSELSLQRKAEKEVAKFLQSFSEESCILPRGGCRSITREARIDAGNNLPPR